MRARNIKPGLWKDDKLAALPIEARYLFPGLWCLADCCGRLDDRPRWIKAEVFPYDDEISAAKVHHLLQLLHEGGFIVRYEVDEKSYIQVTNFLRHQNPHKQEREKGSQIPEPQQVEVHQKKTEVVPIFSEPLPVKTEAVPVKTEVDQKKTEAVQNLSEVVPVSTGVTPDDSGFLIPDSGFLIPDTESLNTHTPPAAALCEGEPLDAAGQRELLMQVGWRGVKKTPQEVLDAIMDIREERLTECPDPENLYMVRARLLWFEEFWMDYWRKDDKVAGRIAYFQSITTLAMHERAVAAAEAQRPAMMKREKGNRPMASTWIHHRRWEDETTEDLPMEDSISC